MINKTAATNTDTMHALTGDAVLNSVHSVNSNNDAQCMYSVPLMKNFFSAEIFGKNAHVLIDTGADVCVADESVIDRYSLRERCQFTPTDRPLLNTANNSSMTVTVMATAPIKIGDFKTAAKFYFVKQLHVDFICGVDWISENDIWLNFKSQVLLVNKRKLLYATEKVTVPPYSEHVFVARIRGDSVPRGVTGVTCGLQSSHLLVGKTLDTVTDNQVRVKCLNATGKPIEIKRNENVGQFKCLTSNDSLCSLHAEAVSKQVHDKPFKPSDQINIADNSDITDANKQSLCDLVNRYAEVFVGPDGALGKCDQHKIELTDYTPVRRRAYRLNPTQQAIMEDKLNELIRQGIIEESTSPWSSPCMLISKKNGEHRLVTDLRGVNAKTVVIANPLPTTQEALENIGMAKPKWFSTMDLQSGFFQAELDPESRQFTAFTTHMGLFQYKTLPQGADVSTFNASSVERFSVAFLCGVHR